VLVIGSGAAARRAAVGLSDRGISSLLVDEPGGTRMDAVSAQQPRRLRVPTLPGVHVTALLVDDGAVFGAYGFSLADGSRYRVRSDAVILATGGHSRVWSRSTPREPGHDGHGLTLAVGAGAAVQDAEMVEFHPFGLLDQGGTVVGVVADDATVLGARLLNNRGERFMSRHEPALLEHAPHQRLACAAWDEIRHGRGSTDRGVWMDLSHLPSSTVRSALPALAAAVSRHQSRDITEDPFEVAPATSRTLGGVRVRSRDGATDVAGLFVTGELAAGVGGARCPEGHGTASERGGLDLAALSAAVSSAGFTSAKRSRAAERAAVQVAERGVDAAARSVGSQDGPALLSRVRAVMTEHAGPRRDRDGLLSALTVVFEVEERAMRPGRRPGPGPAAGTAVAFDLRAATLAARATLECALARRESAGWHERADGPSGAQTDYHLVWRPGERVTRLPAAPADRKPGPGTV
jgi:succinate dehydrogenase / fumarate reductase flavoprotein subunit